MNEQQTIEEELTPSLPNLLLSGFRIAIGDALIGSKRAVKIGDTVYLIPAMYELIKEANQEELQHLLSRIELLDIGDRILIRKFDCPTVIWSR